MPSLAGNNFLHRSRAAHVHVEVKDLLPHWCQKNQMPLLPGVFLGDLQFDGLIGIRHCTEQRRRRLAHLEIYWAVLDLDNDILTKLSIERMEVVVGGAGAISFGISPVQMMVVNEGAVEQDSVMGSKGASDDVGGVGRGTPILRRPGAALGIGFDHEPAEIGDALVNSVGGFLPPRGNVTIKGVKGLQPPNRHGAAHIHRDGQLDPPRAKRIRDAYELRKKVGAQDSRVSVDVVYGASVDADRRQQPGVVADASQIAANLAAVKQNGTSRIAALNRAVEVVPLVDPADGR